MEMKKLFNVLVVGGAVIGTGAACSKPKAAEATPAPAAQAAPSATAPAPKPSAEAPADPPKAEAAPEEKGGGADSW